jgi:hypothetical protein
MRPANLNETPTAYQVLREVVESRLFDVHTALPGVVDKYDPAAKTADIKPSLMRKYKDSGVTELPILIGVPICYFQTSNSIISVPLKQGDDVLILFSERSLDVWKSKEGLVSPGDPRKHHLSDAVAIPMLKRPSKGLPAHADHVLVQHGDLEMLLHEDGKIEVKNSGFELVALMSRLLQAIIDARTATMLGPMPLLNPADPFPTIKANLDTFKA